MEQLHAESITKPSLERLLALEGSGKVHSVFDQTVNLLSSDGSLFTLADASLRDGPNALRIHDFSFKTHEINVGMNLKFNPYKIQIGHELMVTYSNVIVKDEINLIYTLGDQYRNSKIERCILELDQREKPQSNRFIQAIDEKLIELKSELKQNIVNTDEKSTLETLNKFVGLGMGLTPSGDDFVTGFALITSLENYPIPWIKNVLEAVSKTMQVQTNIISRTQFEMALKSEAREEIMILVNNLLSDSMSEINQSVLEEVLNIGSSSGSDLLTGILEAIKIGGK